MFTKLKRQIHNSRERSISRSTTPKNNRSYKQLCLQNNRNYQITWIASHLYQGVFDKHKQKHGQGILITENGVTIIGIWSEGKLHGNAIIATPFAGLIYGSFRRGKLHGWVISRYKSNIEIQNFTDNESTDGVKIVYEKSEGLWVKSLHDHDRKFKRVITIERAKEYELPSFVEADDLKQVFKLIFKYNKFILKTKNIIQIKVDRKFCYYGYVDKHQMPCGLGVLHSDNEVYAGNFQKGCLHKYGLILFDSGTIYKGDIHKGKLKGEGVFYSPVSHQSRLVRIADDDVESIIDEKQGLAIDNIAFPFTIGKVNSYSPDEGFCNETIEGLSSEINRFYYRDYCTQESLSGSDSEESSYNDSLDIEYRTQTSKYKSSSEFKSNETSEKKTAKKFNDYHRQQKSYSKKKPLTYEEMIRREMKKVQYPHLKEFEMNSAEKKYNFHHSKEKAQKPGSIKSQNKY